jgi:hypothetical protein
VKDPRLLDVAEEVTFERLGEDRPPVPVSLARSHDDEVLFEVDVLDPQGKRLVETQATPVDEPCEE